MPMHPDGQGYLEVVVKDIGAGTRYRYVLDGTKERPDPASRFQPDGVHDASMVVDPTSFPWTDLSWRGLPLKDFIIYELHAGTFTGEGTFDAIIPHLSYLQRTVGITAIELMPVAQFPGHRNWGYDGVFLFAPQSTYGGPEGLKRLVDACHARGLAVILDVVYTTLALRVITSATSVPILRIAIGRRGALRSITMGLTARRSGITFSAMPYIG